MLPPAAGNRAPCANLPGPAVARHDCYLQCCRDLRTCQTGTWARESVPDRSEALREVPDLLMLLFLHPGTIGPICDFMELPLLHMEMLTV